MAALTEKDVADLESKGFKRWARGDYDRLYLNYWNYGLKLEFYKSGNISHAEFQGETVSHAEGYRLKESKVYIDVKTGELVVQTASDFEDEIRAAAEKVIEDAIGGIPKTYEIATEGGRFLVTAKDEMEARDIAQGIDLFGFVNLTVKVTETDEEPNCDHAYAVITSITEHARTPAATCRESAKAYKTLEDAMAAVSEMPLAKDVYHAELENGAGEDISCEVCIMKAITMGDEIVGEWGQPIYRNVYDQHVKEDSCAR